MTPQSTQVPVALRSKSSSTNERMTVACPLDSLAFKASGARLFTRKLQFKQRGQTFEEIWPTFQENACICPAPSTSLSQVGRYFIHNSPPGLAFSRASWSSSVPPKTMLRPRNASASATLHKGLPQSPQKESLIPMPFSCVVVVCFGVPDVNLKLSSGTSRQTEYVLPVTLRQVRQWQRACRIS